MSVLRKFSYIIVTTASLIGLFLFSSNWNKNSVQAACCTWTCSVDAYGVTKCYFECDCGDGVHNCVAGDSCIGFCCVTPTPIPATPTPGGGGGGGGGSCTINSAVMSPASVTMNVGDIQTFTLTVNDSPAGCAEDANFVKSNNNIGFGTENPDPSEPFTMDVLCLVDSGGIPTQLTGQARLGGSSAASDTSTVTCSNSGPPTCSIYMNSVSLDGPDAFKSYSIGVVEAPSTVSYSSDDPSICDVVPGPVGPAFVTTVTAGSTVNSTIIHATAYDSTGAVCDTAQTTCDVGNVPSWCQIKEGDVIAAGITGAGDVRCSISQVCVDDPTCDGNLIIYDSGESPGVVAVAGTIDPGVGNVSDPTNYNWFVVNDTYDGKVYNYAYFETQTNQLSFKDPGSTISLVGDFGLPDASGYRWAKRTGDVTIGNDIDIGPNKVVLLVDGNFYINGKINVGTGFFIVISSGDIIVNYNVKDANGLGATPDGLPELEGLYFADGAFISDTESPFTPLDSQLHVRGSVAAGSFDLRRNLPDNSLIPSEFFEFGADQLLQLPASLNRKSVLWKEVAP